MLAEVSASAIADEVQELLPAKGSASTPPWPNIKLLPKQRAFINALWDYTYLLYGGGYRSGKTLVGCYAGLLLSLLYPRNKGLIGRHHATELRTSTMETFFAMCPRAFIRKWTPTEGHLQLINGSEILFTHLDEWEGKKGIELGWAYIDEITDTSYSALKMLLSRLSLPVKLPTRETLDANAGEWLASKVAKGGVDGRKILATTNTDAPGHWVYGAWFGPPPPEGIGLPAGKRFVISSSSRENEYLLPELIAEMDASFDPRYHERYVEGKWVDIDRDRAYYAFDRETHVKSCPLDPYLPLMQSWDFNVNPMTSVVMQRAGRELRVVDEIVIRTSSTPEVCDEFLRRYQSVLRGGACPGLTLYGDATARSRGATTGQSDYAVIAQKYAYLPRVKFSVPRGNPPEVDRIAAVNAKLRSNSGEIGLFVDPKCANLILDLEQVHFKTGARAIDVPTGAKIDKGDDPMRTHISDALGYCIIAEFPVRKPRWGIRHYNIRL